MKTFYKIIDGGTDGMEPNPIVVYADNLNAAKELSEGRGSMGVGNGIIQEIAVYESKQDYEDNNPQARRKKALDKLSESDKKALGL